MCFWSGVEFNFHSGCICLETVSPVGIVRNELLVVSPMMYADMDTGFAYGMGLGALRFGPHCVEYSTVAVVRVGCLPTIQV